MILRRRQVAIAMAHGMGSRRCRTILHRRQAAMTMAHGMRSRRCPKILRTGQVAMTMANVVGVGGAAMRTTGH